MGLNAPAAVYSLLPSQTDHHLQQTVKSRNESGVPAGEPPSTVATDAFCDSAAFLRFWNSPVELGIAHVAARRTENPRQSRHLSPVQASVSGTSSAFCKLGRSQRMPMPDSFF